MRKPCDTFGIHIDLGSGDMALCLRGGSNDDAAKWDCQGILMEYAQQIAGQERLTEQVEEPVEVLSQHFLMQ